MASPWRRHAGIVALTVVATFGSTACGGDPEPDDGPTAAEESEAAAREKAEQEAEDSERRIEDGRETCSDWLDDLQVALRELDSRLSVGLVFADYINAVGDVRVAYDALDVEEAGDAYCIDKVAVPLENALNAYTTAASEWSDCASDLYCNNDQVMPALQQHWLTAQTHIAEAEAGLSDYQDPETFVPSPAA